MPATPSRPLPPVLAGPIPRRVAPDQLVLWLVLSGPFALRLKVYRPGDETPLLEHAVAAASPDRLRIGEQAFVQLIDLRPEAPLPTDVLLAYDLQIETPAMTNITARRSGSIDR
jgi:hypothetical protein